MNVKSTIIIMLLCISIKGNSKGIESPSNPAEKPYFKPILSSDIGVLNVNSNIHSYHSFAAGVYHQPTESASHEFQVGLMFPSHYNSSYFHAKYSLNIAALIFNMGWDAGIIQYKNKSSIYTGPRIGATYGGTIDIAYTPRLFMFEQSDFTSHAIGIVYRFNFTHMRIS